MFRKLIAFGAFILIASPAHAQLEVCNKTTDEIAVAIAYDSEQDTISEGWTKIAPTACAEVLSNPLSQPYYYYYAITKAQSLQWTGPYRFCAADETNFRVKGASGCEERGYRTLGFNQFSVGNYKTFSFNIRGTGPAPAAAPAAEPALDPAFTPPDVPAVEDPLAVPATEPAPDSSLIEAAPPATPTPDVTAPLDPTAPVTEAAPADTMIEAAPPEVPVEAAPATEVPAAEAPVGDAPVSEAPAEDIPLMLPGTKTE